MRRFALFAVAMFGVMAALSSGCPKAGGPTRGEDSRDAGPSLTEDASTTALQQEDAEDCNRVLNLFETITNSKSQSLFYYGGDLNAVRYLEPTGESNAEGQQFRAYLRLPNGDSETALITITKKGDDTHNPTVESMPVYEATSCERKLCDAQSYTSTDEENLPDTVHAVLKGGALLVSGYWEDGVWKQVTPDGKPAYSLSCFTGAVAKCVHWGYVPGLKDDAGTDLTPYYQACVRAARAMYAEGRDESFTCPSTEVEVYDRRNRLKKNNDARHFESLWNANGLVCLKKPRWKNCEKELEEAGVNLNARCVDPVPDAGADWPQGGDPDGGIIAISMDPGGHETGHGCPSQIKDETLCKQKPRRQGKGR